MQYGIQYFCKKVKYTEHTERTMKSRSVYYSGPLHTTVAMCIFTLFNVEPWSATTVKFNHK